MAVPEPEEQVQFLFKLQRLLSEGTFTATYKYALLLSLADLAVERGNDDTEVLALDTTDLAEKFIDLYWRQVLPWMPEGAGEGRRLHQNKGREAAILGQLARAHERWEGSLLRLRSDKKEWRSLVRRVGRVVETMPLWKLQTVAGQKLDFIYPNVGKGKVFRLRGDAVYCFRRFRDLIGDMTEGAWVRWVRRLPGNRELLGDTQDVREFLFGADRTALNRVRSLLREHDGPQCFYCGRRVRGDAAVDHFIPWSRYRLDLGHNYVLADARCNGHKRDRLAAVDHVRRWQERNAKASWAAALSEGAVPANQDLTRRVAAWAYGQADSANSLVWTRGSDGLVPLDSSWRAILFA